MCTREAVLAVLEAGCRDVLGCVKTGILSLGLDMYYLGHIWRVNTIVRAVAYLTYNSHVETTYLTSRSHVSGCTRNGIFSLRMRYVSDCQL